MIDAKELLNERPETLNPNMNDEIKSAYNKGWNACNSEWISLIDEQPTADVVEVVRCKDCEYGEIDDIDIPSQYLCHYEGYSWNDENHYCSYGKKV